MLIARGCPLVVYPWITIYWSVLDDGELTFVRYLAQWRRESVTAGRCDRILCRHILKRSDRWEPTYKKRAIVQVYSVFTEPSAVSLLLPEVPPARTLKLEVGAIIFLIFAPFGSHWRGSASRRGFSSQRTHSTSSDRLCMCFRMNSPATSRVGRPG